MKSFERQFSQWAGRVRRRLAMRQILTGVAFGVTLGLLPAVVGWKLRNETVRRAAPVAALVGAIAGFAIARRKRWSDTDVALYLDGQLKSEEAIATAVELQSDEAPDSDEEARAVVISKAQAALDGGKPKDAKPGVFRLVHLAAPLSIAAMAFVIRMPLPPAPIEPLAPGSTLVQVNDV